MDIPKTTYYEELFIKETGKQVWLPTWSEKYNEERFYLNPEYCEWLNNRIDNFINRKYNKKSVSLLFLSILILFLL